MEAHALVARSFNRKCYTNGQGRRLCDGLPVGAIVAMVLALVIILPLGFVLACRSRRRSRKAPASSNTSTHARGLPYDVESGSSDMMHQRLDSTAYLEKVLSEDVTPAQAPPPYPVPAAAAVAVAAPPVAAVRSTSQRSITPPAIPAPAPVMMRGWPMGLIAASQRPTSNNGTGTSNASTPAGSPRMGHARHLSHSGSSNRQHSRHGSTSAAPSRSTSSNNNTNATQRDERRHSRREGNAASPFTDGAAEAPRPIVPRSDGRF